MNGRASSMATKIARIFGTKTSVISWICVSAWNSEITTPTTRPTIISGLETRTNVMIASRATSSTSGPVMASPGDLTDVCRAACFRGEPAGGLLRRSDRHLHDLLVGGDDLVAHRHQCGDGGLGFGDRRHHVDQVGLLPRHHGLRLGIRFRARRADGAERVLEEGAEARALARRVADRLVEAAQPGGGIGDARYLCIGACGNSRCRHPPGPCQLRRMSRVRWIMRRVAPITLTLAS